MTFDEWLKQGPVVWAFRASESARVSYERGETLTFAYEFWRGVEAAKTDHRDDAGRGDESHPDSGWVEGFNAGHRGDL